MKIWGDSPKVFGIYNKQNQVGKTQSKGFVASGKDEYVVSNQAKDFQTIMKALAGVPDIREDKVQKISAQIQSGEYNVEARDISEKIVSKISSDKV